MIERIVPDGARVLTFEISGPYALFKKPYSPMSPVSFPIPPPTAIFGILGAIAGWQKDQYLERINRGDCAVTVRVMNPVEKFRAAVNLLDTSESFRLKGHIQIPFEFLRDARFRVFFWHGDETDVLSPLREKLESGTTAFTPALGLANCFAEIEYRGEKSAELRVSRTSVGLTCAVPVENGKPVIHYDLSGKRVTRITVPSRMTPDRRVEKYQTVVVGEEGNGQTIAADVEFYYECGEDRLLFF